MTTAYEAGQSAAKTKGMTQEHNPYLGAPGRGGVRRYTDENAGGEWARGFRDARDAASKQFADVSTFRRKRNRYYA